MSKLNPSIAEAIAAAIVAASERASGSGSPQGIAISTETGEVRDLNDSDISEFMSGESSISFNDQRDMEQVTGKYSFEEMIKSMESMNHNEEYPGDDYPDEDYVERYYITRIVLGAAGEALAHKVYVFDDSEEADHAFRTIVDGYPIQDPPFDGVNVPGTILLGRGNDRPLPDEMITTQVLEVPRDLIKDLKQ